MPGNKFYHFRLNIGPDELMRVYTGSAHRLRVTTVEGLVLDLDANHLRRFTTRNGILGNFRLVTDANNKFLRLDKLA